jgi:hypothetical protein
MAAARGGLNVKTFALAGARNGREAAKDDAADDVVAESGQPHSGLGFFQERTKGPGFVAQHDVDGFIVLIQNSIRFIAGAS